MINRWFVAMTWLMCFVAAAVSVQSQSSQGIAPAVTQFDPQPWIDDFHELTSAMASHYADLDWAIRDRGMNLPKLRQDTEEKLRHSGDEQSARDAMQEFLDAFGDGHLSIEWEKPDASRNAATSKASKSLCGRLNYKMNLQPGVDFSLLPGFEAAGGEDSQLFSGGLLTLQTEPR